MIAGSTLNELAEREFLLDKYECKKQIFLQIQHDILNLAKLIERSIAEIEQQQKTINARFQHKKPLSDIELQKFKQAMSKAKPKISEDQEKALGKDLPEIETAISRFWKEKIIMLKSFKENECRKANEHQQNIVHCYNPKTNILHIIDPISEKCIETSQLKYGIFYESCSNIFI